MTEVIHYMLENELQETIPQLFVMDLLDLLVRHMQCMFCIMESLHLFPYGNLIKITEIFFQEEKLVHGEEKQIQHLLYMKDSHQQSKRSGIFENSPDFQKGELGKICIFHKQ